MSSLDGPRRDSHTDRGTWDELRAGSERAFAALFARYGDEVYNFAFRRVACWATADDVTQATFLALWRRVRVGRVEELRGESARGVLLAMASKECANALRGTRRLAALRRKVPVDEVSRDHADAVAADVDSERRMRQIRAVVDRLPAGQRAVVELVWWSGCSMQETADALDVPVGTVKSRLARARARLGEQPVIVRREELA
ncbi:sigma-70 family RNA polymerase sigma factor [Mumia zhuanghuii]|uniref:RNA polymerase sigma factor n=2 Tax=Mumia TaxID=1546255 RepID=A0ABW1QHW9_9ACTN|nr:MULTISPECIES: sigma-70 family RNA polymerase sigma factor [Mumia]KAA1424560.1 sigma-70 family RNA polymerase sigma factor [Mumia zhuanghuii]